MIVDQRIEIILHILFIHVHSFCSKSYILVLTWSLELLGRKLEHGLGFVFFARLQDGRREVWLIGTVRIVLSL